MIVEPVPAAPRSRRRRVAGWLGLAGPVVLLVGVVAGGVLGQAAAPPSARPSASVAAVSPARPSPITAAGSPVPVPGVDPALLAGGFPTVSADLAVAAVPDALTFRTAVAPDTPIAVAGYLGWVESDPACADAFLGPLNPLCERRSVLTDQPWRSSGGPSASWAGSYLHLRFPVGVRIPDEVEAVAAPFGGLTASPGPIVGSPSPSVPVVIVGRSDGLRDPCHTSGSGCGDTVLVDRVTWVNGTDVASVPVLDVGLDPLPTEWTFHYLDAAEVGTVGWTGTVLVAALVLPATVDRIDPAAGAALASLRPAAAPQGLVWYVRGLDTGYDPTHYALGRSPPLLRWLVFDNVTGRVLAKGPADSPRTAAIAVPAQMAQSAP